MLYVPTDPSSAIIATCALIYFVTVATGIVGADYAPSMCLVALGAICPAALWLVSFGGGLELTLGVSLLVLLPAMACTGHIALRKSRAEIINRLEIAELLATRDRQARQIEKLFSERTHFFSAASHDMRQPLNAMGLYFELLSRSPSQQEQDDIIHRLKDCAGSLLRQFDAIMGVSTADMDIRNADIRSVALQDVFDRVAATLELEAGRKGLRLRVCRSGLNCSADTALLERALLNLVGNAIKYTPRGSVLIGARRRGASVEIVVADTGVGIDAQHLDAIFEDFFQVGNSERDREKGLGIGLGIVRRLCEAMQWSINVRSRIGHGTVFRLTVPFASSPPKEATVQFVPTPADTTLGVVIIDDDLLIRDSLSRLLTDWGHECVAFEGSDAALAFLRENSGRKRWIALLDYRLADGETGLAVADRLRAAFEALPISLMTGDIGPEIVEGAKHRGLALMRKPIQPIKLSALLSSEAA
jgi:signal transduction histidine kinase/CheY-like chemotaxis protein